MIDGATAVWVAEGGASASPGDAATRALEAWAKARGVVLRSPTPGGARPLPIDWSAADRVEEGLARVRDALAGLDFDAAERELARAEAVLRDHPELPQAAWLRAEVERAWSVRWLRSGDDERSRRAWQRAAGLDGGREAGLGEKAFERAPTIVASIRLAGGGDDGDRAGAGLRLDGSRIASGDVTRSPGEHALAIVDAEGRTTWAEWVSLAAGTVVRIAAPAAPACSSQDFARVRIEAGAVRAAGVACAAWVAVTAEPSGAIRVANCDRAFCDAFQEWREEPPPWDRPRPPPSPEARSTWPAWATWTLVGAGVVGAGFGIAAAAGAFRSSSPPETQFVNGGLEVHSF